MKRICKWGNSVLKHGINNMHDEMGKDIKGHKVLEREKYLDYLSIV